MDSFKNLKTVFFNFFSYAGFFCNASSNFRENFSGHRDQPAFYYKAEFDELGRKINETKLAGQLKRIFTYDSQERLKSFSDALGNPATPIFSENISYKPFSSLISQIDYTYYSGVTVDNNFTHTQSFDYDPLGQLLTAKQKVGPLAEQTITDRTYDANGITTRAFDPKSGLYRTLSYAANTNKLTAITYEGSSTGNTSLAYDAEGRVISMAGSSYEYDLYTGKTAKITLPIVYGGTKYDKNYTKSKDFFAYGPAGERALKRFASTLYGAQYTQNTTTTTKYLHASNPWPLVEYEQTTVNLEEKATKITRYIYGPGGILATHSGQTITVPVTDHIGSTRVVLTANINGLGANGTTQLTAANVAEKYRYYPFGAVAAKAILSGKSDYLYTGQEFDEETGLHNYRARMMSGTDELGRFFSMDPQHQTHSPYTYAGNNPISNVDPDGELYIWDDAIVAGTAFTIGYVSHGLKHGDWGWDAAKQGGIYAVSATIMYNMGPVGGKDAAQLAGAYKFSGNFLLNTALSPYLPSKTISLGPESQITLSSGVYFTGGGISPSGNISYTAGANGTSATWGIGFGGNHVGASFGMYDANADIGFTKYYTSYGNAVGPDGNANNQIVGGLQIYRSRAGGGWSFRIENDFSKLGGDGGDRWRSNAVEFSKGLWSVGTNLYTNEVDENAEDAIDWDGESKFWKKNRSQKLEGGEYNSLAALRHGKVYSAPAWIGYRNGPVIVRIGSSHKPWQNPESKNAEKYAFYQDFNQNGVHKWFGPGRTNYFNNYDDFVGGWYFYHGYYNPYSLWGR